MTAATTAPGSGLSIVQGLVTLHGGEVDITSRVGEGTRVSVRLPIDCEAARPKRPASTVAHPAFDRVVAASDALIRKTA